MYYYIYNHFDGLPVEFWEDCTTIKDFMDNVVTVPEYHTVDKTYKNAFSLDDISRNNLTTATTGIEQSLNQLETLFSTISTDSEYLLNVSQINSIQSVINSFSNSIYPLLDNMEATGIITLNNLVPQIQALPNILSFHPKLKKVWEVKVKSISNGTASILSTEWSDSRVIANNCFLEDGQAVFEAQSLLRQIGENSFTDSNISCIRNIPRKEMESSVKTSNFKVFPNPSNGKWTIDLNDSKHGLLNIQISNNLGKIVYSEMIDKDVDSKQVTVEGLTNGLYLMNIFQENTVIYTQKLIVLDK